MRHKVAGYKLGRDTEHRKAMWRNIAIALFTHGQITTTVPKAKSVQPLVEKLITLAKKGDLASRRRVIQQIGNPILVDRDLSFYSRKVLATDGYRLNKYHELQDGPRVVKKLFDDIAPQYVDRPGGYTRIVRLSRYRVGDGSQLCVLQLVGKEEGPQVSGKYSRRREKANRRMEFAAKLRKARSGGKGQDEPAPDEAQAQAAVVEDQHDAPQQSPDDAPDQVAADQPDPDAHDAEGSGGDDATDES